MAHFDSFKPKNFKIKLNKEGLKIKFHLKMSRYNYQSYILVSITDP